MKKVFIIGAGFLQSFIIKKAKEMGYYTLAVDADPDAVGFAYADKYGVVNIVDSKACLAFAEENSIDGVLTAATEYGVLTAAYIAQEMNLPGLNYASAQIVKNKYMVRKCLISNNVDDSCGQAYLVDEDTNISKVAQKLHYPVMVKPCDGSGSRGASRVDRPEEFSEAVNYAITNSRSQSIVVEPFIFGKEYGAEALVENGEIHVLAIMKKKMTEPPYYAELGHAIPCGLPSDIEEKAKNCVRKAIRALGINFSAVNVDMLITDEGKIHIVDIGARMGGNMIGTCVIPYGTGIDYMGEIIKTSLGETVEIDAKPHDNAMSLSKGPVATRLLAFPDGIIKQLPDFEQLERDYDVEIYHHMKQGDIVHEYHTNLDGLGYIVAKAETVDKAEDKAETVLDYIRHYAIV